jgi:hypothetical protein
MIKRTKGATHRQVSCLVMRGQTHSASTRFRETNVKQFVVSFAQWSFVAWIHLALVIANAENVVVTFVHINDHHSHVDEHELVIPVQDLPSDVLARLKVFQEPSPKSSDSGNSNSSNNNYDPGTLPPHRMDRQIVIRYGK